MTEEQRNNPLHGIKLEALLTELLEHYDWEDLAEAINLNCFKSNPSIKSSLKFLRKFPWAREKVESFYLYRYKRLLRPNDEQYELPPRERTILPKKESHASEINPSNEPAEDVWGNWKKKNNDVDSEPESNDD
ncbi:MAG TPA: DNA-binding protein VF530 [Thiotrichaceae bacterium]|jgi:uncharacterized protein (DUF2132 family)|nr:DNA-binding protein VF530 [Thiotrichaceae bacterium]HIM07526.1 DNA-binding protein VF530 [Gammaproteobacteria bacterium]